MRVVIPTVATAALLAVIYAAQADDSAPKANKAQQSEALRERPDNLSGEKMRDPGTTDMGRENDDNITRPLTREDVVRDILNNQRSNEAANRPWETAGGLVIVDAVTTLILASTKRYFNFGEKDDHVVLDGGRVIGRIFQQLQAPEGRPWFWTITAMDYPPTIHSRGYSATREQAMADFKAQWLSP